MTVSTPPIESLAPIGNGRTAAIIDRTGSIGWLSLPDFDQPSVFADLLGNRRHGFWSLAPVEARSAPAGYRAYRPGSLVLDQVWELPSGTLQVTDFMPASQDPCAQVIRIAQCLDGQVTVSSRLLLAPGYGLARAVLRRVDGEAGTPRFAAEHQRATLWLDGPAHATGRRGPATSDTVLSAGQKVSFALTWQQPGEAVPLVPDAERALADTLVEWEDWSSRCTYTGPDREAVLSSAAFLGSLIHVPTGGIVAAVTTSLPEEIGGERNWDYRYCWLRDSALTVRELVRAGSYLSPVRAWRSWLVDTIGDPATVRIMYRLNGDSDLTETPLSHLPGYQGSRPVRIGNGAAGQLQLDVFGYVADALLAAEDAGLEPDPDADALLLGLADVVAANWGQPDQGIWEMRGPERHFTSSKVMAWVAIDRTLALLERRPNTDAPTLAGLRSLASAIHADILAHGFDAGRNTFVQYYGGQELDASLLLLPQVGFLPLDDKRTIGTVEAVQRELATYDGLVLRYRTHQGAEDNVDGLRGHEGAFLACSFWLVTALALIGRDNEARERMDALLALRSDVGVLAEEYDPSSGRQLGNTPQGLSHLALINAACALAPTAAPTLALPRQRASAVSSR
ncbi:glycoside hydrolase family 15 protein [Kitasatospora cystarginea]|uniref:Glycoside hydrolase family 15 protein n=1 Tax=Kitasatospora cystarginea TaxID=58350 RepID=A0ABN3ED61_9ACTN